MRISTKSWHYRLNRNTQGYSFVDRIDARRFTTCTYIRTTIRSMFQLAFTSALILALVAACAGLVFNAIWVPLAIWLDLPLNKNQIPPAAIFWFVLTGLGFISLLTSIIKRLQVKLSDRHEKKLSLLEQRIKDGKEGICTIVEVE